MHLVHLKQTNRTINFDNVTHISHNHALTHLPATKVHFAGTFGDEPEYVLVTDEDERATLLHICKMRAANLRPEERAT